MTTPIDPFERRLPQTFTDLAAARTPDYLVDILGQTARTRQRPAWAIPGRWNPMLNLTSRPALALLTVILIAVLAGGGILLTRGNQPGVGGQASPSPSTSPLPSAVNVTTLDIGQSLAAGTYRVGTPFGLPLRLSSTSGIQVDRLTAGEFRMVLDPAEDGYLLVDLVEDVSTDPCRSETAPLVTPAPTTVDDFVAALGGMPGFTVSDEQPIAIDGHAGTEFNLSNSLDPDTAACDGGTLIPIWTYRGGGSTSINPGATDEHVAVIDVDGTLVALGWGASADQNNELVRSLDFE